MATNSSPWAVIFFSSALVVSGWMVEESTSSLLVGFNSRMLSTIASTDASLPRHMKMMSAFWTTSAMVAATVVLSLPSFSESWSARFWVRL